MRTNYSLTRFILYLLKPYKRYMVTFALGGLFLAITNTVLPYTLKIIIDKATEFHGSLTHIFPILQPYIVLYIGLWVFFALNLRALDYARLKLFPNLKRDITSSMFSYLNLHSHNYFQNNFAGSLINKIVDMLGGVVTIITISEEIFGQILAFTIALTTLAFVSPIFAIILIVWVIIFMLITFAFLKPIQQLSHVFAEARSSLVGKMIDSIGNIVNVRLFAHHEFENQYIGSVIDDTVRKDIKMETRVILMRCFWDVSIISLLGINLWMLAHMYSQGLVTIGDFSFVISLSISMIWNLWYTAGQFVTFYEIVGKCNQALSILNEQHDILDNANAKKLVVKKGQIEFKEVNFHYGENLKLFQNKNIIINPGEKIGLVGFSGSGKSTFVNLILRLYDVTSGKITIDKQNIKDITQNSLRENIALIPQDISLFHRTLMENIRYGRNNATDDDVINAAKKAHCHEFISILQDGYQAMVVSVASSYPAASANVLP